MAREGKVSGLNAASHYDAAMSVFPWYERAIYALAMAVLWAFSKLMWRWSVDAPSKLPERVEGSTGSVVICNHTSMAEVVALVPYLWARGHRVRPIFKSEFNKIGIARWAFALAGGIPVERGEADMAALRAAQHALQRGEDVLIFPEGTRRPQPLPSEFKSGIWRLMKEFPQVELIPVYIENLHRAMPKGVLLPVPTVCSIRFGAPLEHSPEDLKEDFLERARNAIISLAQP